jgi:hypothetical protein
MASWIRRAAPLLLAFLTAAVVVDPTGNFPLNDDWSYAKAVQRWVEEGELRFGDWAAMTQLTHVALGAAVTSVTGFSHVALRFTTLAIVVAFIVWMGRRGAWHAPAAFALVFNPLFFSLSFTFMTDILFAVLFWMSMDLLIRNRTGWGTAAAVAATLTRQTGVGIGLSWVVVGAMSGRFARAASDKGALGAPLRLSIALIGVLIVYAVLMRHIGAISGNYNTLGDLLWILDHERPFARMGGNLALLMVYLGLFALPLMPLNLDRIRRDAPAWVTGLLAVGLLALTWGRFPMTHDGNLLMGWGIGPAVVPGGHGLAAPFPWLGPVLNVLGALGGAVLIVRTAAAWRDPDTDEFLRWGLVVCAGYLLFLVAGRFLFDRYLLLLLPFVLMVVGSGALSGRVARAPHGGRPLLLISWLMIAIMAGYSIWATRVQHDWNRARWANVEAMIEAGVPPQEIKGGFEVEGWFRE